MLKTASGLESATLFHPDRELAELAALRSQSYSPRQNRHPSTKRFPVPSAVAVRRYNRKKSFEKWNKKRAPHTRLSLGISSCARLPLMRIYDRFVSPGYEQKLQETRYERQAERKRVERLCALLAKKVDSAKTKARPARVA